MLISRFNHNNIEDQITRCEDDILEEIKIHYIRVANFERMKKDMTEHQAKELAKWLVDNGQRKLTKEEKRRDKIRNRSRG